MFSMAPVRFTRPALFCNRSVAAPLMLAVKVAPLKDELTGPEPVVVSVVTGATPRPGLTVPPVAMMFLTEPLPPKVPPSTLTVLLLALPVTDRVPALTSESPV